jgi:hypothetical protein
LVHINVLSTQHGSVDPNITTFTPETNFTGSAGITFQAIDSKGAPSQSTLTVRVVQADTGQVTLLPDKNDRTVAIGQPVAFNVTPMNDPNGTTRKVTWKFSDKSKPYPGPLVTRAWATPRTITATATISGMPTQTIQVRVVRPPLQLLSVKVTPSRVKVQLRANVAGTVKLSLGKAGSTTRKLKKNQVVTKTWAVGGRPRLRTMMLQAQLKPSAKTTLPGSLKLVRAVVLPLR